MTINVALLGAGRIGQMHAHLIHENAFTNLLYVNDSVDEVAQKTAQQYGATVADVDVILADAQVNAVLIASTTETHIDLVIKSIGAKKAIFCEKPLDLDIDKINACQSLMTETEVPFLIGFNRRFDPSHRALAESVLKGQLGQLEALVITSRDPALPPIGYIQKSGGLFHDMMIHDFDMARFILGEEPVEIHAMGSVQVDPEIAEYGDVDSAMVGLKTKSGTLCHIHCSRRAVYGYDQRIEAFGSAGMLISDNPAVNSVKRYDEKSSAAPQVMHHFFVERYEEAYQKQWAYFIQCVLSQQKPTPGFQDAREAIVLADAAKESLKTGQPIKLL